MAGRSREEPQPISPHEIVDFISSFIETHIVVLIIAGTAYLSREDIFDLIDTSTTWEYILTGQIVLIIIGEVAYLGQVIFSALTSEN